MNVEDSIVPGCRDCLKRVAHVKIAQGALARIAHKMSTARTQASLAALTEALPKAKIEIIEGREWLEDHLAREHA